MAKGEFTDGICDTCGRPGLAGERCMDCGDIIAKIDSDTGDPLLNQDDVAKPGEPEEYPDEISLESLSESGEEPINDDENI